MTTIYEKCKKYNSSHKIRETIPQYKFVTEATGMAFGTLALIWIVLLPFIAFVLNQQPTQSQIPTDSIILVFSVVIFIYNLPHYIRGASFVCSTIYVKLINHIKNLKQKWGAL